MVENERGGAQKFHFQVSFQNHEQSKVDVEIQQGSILIDFYSNLVTINNLRELRQQVYQNVALNYFWLMCGTTMLVFGFYFVAELEKIINCFYIAILTMFTLIELIEDTDNIQYFFLTITAFLALIYILYQKLKYFCFFALLLHYFFIFTIYLGNFYNLRYYFMASQLLAGILVFSLYNIAVNKFQNQICVVYISSFIIITSAFKFFKNFNYFFLIFTFFTN